MIVYGEKDFFTNYILLCGCSKSFLKCILGMYSSVKYSVKLEDGTTPFFNSFVGVKQGCNLSTTLFNIFINDVPNFPEGFTILFNET